MLTKVENNAGTTSTSHSPQLTVKSLGQRDEILTYSISDTLLYVLCIL